MSLDMIFLIVREWTLHEEFKDLVESYKGWLQPEGLITDAWLTSQCQLKTQLNSQVK